MIFWSSLLRKVKNAITRKEFDDLNQEVEINKANIEINKNNIDINKENFNNYYNKSQSDSKYGLKSDVANNQSEIRTLNTELANTNNRFNNYYNTTQSDSRYALKNDVYNKTETYTKSEVNGLISNYKQIIMYSVRIPATNLGPNTFKQFRVNIDRRNLIYLGQVINRGVAGTNNDYQYAGTVYPYGFNPSDGNIYYHVYYSPASSACFLTIRNNTNRTLNVGEGSYDGQSIIVYFAEPEKIDNRGVINATLSRKGEDIDLINNFKV